MARLESKKKMLDWQRTQRLGRRRIAKAAKDPAARSILRQEALLPISSLGPPTLNSSRTDANAGENTVPVPLPPFLSGSADPDSPAVTGQNDNSFFAFPPEVRNTIYQYAVEYPTCRALFDTYYRQKEKRARRNTRGIKTKLHTPTILLLCKPITLEALTILRSQPFVIDNIPPWVYGHRLPLPITDFISARTLQNIAFFEFKLTLGEGSCGSGDVWCRVLKPVFDAWAQRNSVGHLRVMFKLSNLGLESVWYYELRDYERLVDNVRLPPLPPRSTPQLVYSTQRVT